VPGLLASWAAASRQLLLVLLQRAAALQLCLGGLALMQRRCQPSGLRVQLQLLLLGALQHPAGPWAAPVIRRG
jgi:hypothetical protein